VTAALATSGKLTRMSKDQHGRRMLPRRDLPSQRDQALRRLRRANGAILAGAIVTMGVLTDVTAQAFAGHRVTRTTTPAAATSAATTSAATGSVVESAPTRSTPVAGHHHRPRHHHAGLNPPANPPQAATTSAPTGNASTSVPAPSIPVQSAAVQVAPAPSVAVQSAPVVSGGS